MLCWCVWCVVLCCTWLCCVVLCCVHVCCVVLCCAVLCCTVPCRAMLCCAVLCCAVLCCVVLCCDALCWIVCCDALYIYSWALLCFIMLLLCCVMLLHCVVIHCALSCRRPVLFYLSCHVGIVSCRTTLRSEGEGEGVRCVMFLLCYVMFCFIVLYVYYVALCGLLNLELIFVVLSLFIPTAKMSCHSNQYTRYIPFQPQKVIQDCGQRHQQQQSNPVN